MTLPDGRDGEDVQRRAREKAANAIKADKERRDALPKPPDCDCFGSMFSHDLNCAFNLWLIDQAGYKLVEK